MKIWSKYLVWTGVLVGLVMLMLSLMTSVYGLWMRQDIVGQQARRLKEARLENNRLKKGLLQAEGPFFVEQVARDELGLVLEGETVVLMDKSGFAGNKPEVGPINDSNWHRWWQLFF